MDRLCAVWISFFFFFSAAPRPRAVTLMFLLMDGAVDIRPCNLLCGDFLLVTKNNFVRTAWNPI